MAWQDYSILGGDITKDTQYEILKLVVGADAASDMMLRGNRCSFTGIPHQNIFLGKLSEIYDLCKSNNKIEETWNMQVLGLFILESASVTRGYIKRESAHVVWNHIKYELDNIYNFGWASTMIRKDHVNNLYTNFGYIHFQGGYTPFGLPVETTASATTPGGQNIPSTMFNPLVDAPVTSLTLPPAPRPVSTLETINVSTGVLPGQHTVVRVVTGWTKYTYSTKQWWYRLLATNRGYIVQTRWGKSWRRTDLLRVTTKAFGSERQASNYISRTVATKQRGGYVIA